jgi:tight adherence protein B
MIALIALASVGFSVAVFVFLIGFGRVVSSKDPTIKDRMDILVVVPAMEEDDGATPEPRKGLRGLVSRLGRSLSGRASSSSAATELARADLPMTISEYRLLTAGSGLALFLVAQALSGRMVIAFLAALIGSRLPGLYLRRRQKKRWQAFQDQLADSLTLLVGTLRAGYGITAALDAVAKQMPPPVSNETARVVHEVGLGKPTPEALGNMARRVQSDDLELVVTAINVHSEIGGNLSTILEAITSTIRERVRIKRQLQALTVQHKLTRYLLTGLPFGLAVVLFIINPEYMSALFRPGWTLLIPITAVALLVSGWLVMGKLAEIEV